MSHLDIVINNNKKNGTYSIEIKGDAGARAGAYEHVMAGYLDRHTAFFETTKIMRETLEKDPKTFITYSEI